MMSSSWSNIFRNRADIHKIYPDIWALKIIRKRLPFMLKYIKDGDKILDIGASSRDLEMRIKKHRPQIVYKSMDIDREVVHDYYSLDEVEETFDVVFLFEVIEHLGLEEGVNMFRKIHSLLKEGGYLILSTPNTFNPGRFWRDATHRVAYCYDELGGLLLGQSFKIKGMYRTYNDAFHRYLFRVYVMFPLHRYLGIDFAKSILIVAERQRKVQ
jgi:2-polyprenyl-3-methyl-5-hydroxy-6-metoxy-1,4-benzoquinol methylase